MKENTNIKKMGNTRGGGSSKMSAKPNGDVGNTGKQPHGRLLTMEKGGARGGKNAGKGC